MTIDPLLPWWALVPLFGFLFAVCIALLVRRSRQRVSWLRRLLMVALLFVVALRPVTPIDGMQTERMNANVFFVVDLTGSMNAEDYGDEEQTRLDGVKSDMQKVMDMTQGARYSIIAFDSTATSQLPLTTDAGAARAWIDTARTEVTAFSTGSNVDRPLRALNSALSNTQKEDPDSSILVYFFSDGENTDNKESESFGPLATYVDGGGVLGYGTAEGGPMKVRGGEKSGEYVTDSSGERGVSKLDQQQLQNIAGQLGVPYLHRTDPEEPIEGTMDGVTLRAIPQEDERAVPSYDDWYWIAAIPLAVIFIWELAAVTYRIPRRIDRYDITGMGT